MHFGFLCVMFSFDFSCSMRIVRFLYVCFVAGASVLLLFLFFVFVSGKSGEIFKTHHLSICSHLNWIRWHWLKWKRNNYLKIVYRMCGTGRMIVHNIHCAPRFFSSSPIYSPIFCSMKCNWTVQSVAQLMDRYGYRFVGVDCRLDVTILSVRL